MSLVLPFTFFIKVIFLSGFFGDKIFNDGEEFKGHVGAILLKDLVVTLGEGLL